jgi:hypothetical protein
MQVNISGLRLGSGALFVPLMLSPNRIHPVQPCSRPLERQRNSMLNDYIPFQLTEVAYDILVGTAGVTLSTRIVMSGMNLLFFTQGIGLEPLKRPLT